MFFPKIVVVVIKISHTMIPNFVDVFFWNFFIEQPTRQIYICYIAFVMSSQQLTQTQNLEKKFVKVVFKTQQHIWLT